MYLVAKVICSVFIIFTLIISCSAPGYKRPITNEPLSKEATLSEVVSPCEWLIEASGIGEGSGKKREAAAIIDARKSAVSFVLSGGTDPLLQTQEEKDRYANIKDTLFLEHIYSKFISYESSTYENRVRMPNETVKISKMFKINRCSLKNYLIEKKVLIAEDSLKYAIGLPFIMVIPETKPGESPIDLLSSDPLSKKASQVIESFLTARRYDVQVPEQKVALDELIKSHLLIKGQEEDEAYGLALTIGSDVYITYTINISENYVAGQHLNKAIVGVRAFETTTARLLGTETGYSQERPVPSEAVVEEALNGAIENVLTRIDAYWKQDLTRGSQYKLVINLPKEISPEENDYFSLKFNSSLKTLCQGLKENIVSDYTLDYCIWVTPAKLATSSDVFRALQEEISGNPYARQLRRVILNHKLLLLSIS